MPLTCGNDRYGPPDSLWVEALNPGRLASDALDMAQVLIIDKDPAGRAMLAWYLSLEGHTTIEAASANEALGALTHEHPDVIVTEVVLPDMSGHQLLAYLHTQGIAADATVIVATECRDLDWMVRSWELGACAHLTKPIGPEAIADVIAREVRSREVVLSS